MEDRALNFLIAEYQSWTDAQELPQLPAEELLHEELTSAQREWVSDFILRWELEIEG